MYIKLNFTQNKTGEQVFRILTDIINNADTVTSVSALTTRFTSVSAAADLLSGFDSANSELITTSPINTSLTKAHICRNLAAADTFQFTLEQSVYDSTSTKYYTRIYADRGAGAVGTTNTIPYVSHSTGGAFTCTATTLAQGDRVTITGTYGGTGSITSYASGNTYIVSAVTGTSPSVTGFTLINDGSTSVITTTAGTATGLTFQAQSPMNIYVGDGSIPAFNPATSMAITVASRAASTSGTPLTLSNIYTPAAWTSSALTNEYMSMQNTCVRTLWCYITDDTFLIGFNGMASTTLGWPTGISQNSAYLSSNIFVSQYTRLDHWNTSSNNVIPVIWTKPRAAYATNYTSNYGAGFGAAAADYLNIWSPINSATNHAASVPTVLLNAYNTYPSASSYSITKLYNQFVAPGVGLKNSEAIAIQGSAVADNAASTATSGYSYTPISLATAGAGAPNATLTSRTYHLHPLTWMRSDIGAFGGGNISEQSGFYIYTGDYTAGDEFTYSGTTYSIWPTSVPTTTSRLGIAVPKV